MDYSNEFTSNLLYFIILYYLYLILNPVLIYNYPLHATYIITL